ncbi:MAG: acyl carrier protein [Actinomycetes bacterium]
MTPEKARSIVLESVRRIVPDADLETLRPDDNLRDTLELDSLDFLGLVEMLSERTGLRIDEDDYGRLDTLSSCVDYLAGSAS